MGARAAVLAATEVTTHLVLASYPLHTAKEIRDQVLLDLPEFIKIIFVSGDRDEMCDLERLEDVRKKMKCTTWRVVVQNADHGMNVKPKAGTREVGKKTGEIVAMWLKSSDASLRESKISWNADEETAQWSGWSLGKADQQTNVSAQSEPSPETTKKTDGGKRKQSSDDIYDQEEARLTKSKKRRKP